MVLFIFQFPAIKGFLGMHYSLRSLEIRTLCGQHFLALSSPRYYNTNRLRSNSPMRYFSRAIALLCAPALVVCAVWLLAVDPSFAYQVSTLPNGLTVAVEENHAVDLVAVDVWVKAGNGCETANNSGVSHFVEHLIFGATAKRKAGQLDMEMESVGATLDAHTSLDWAHFHTTVGSRYVAKAVEVLHNAGHERGIRQRRRRARAAGNTGRNSKEAIGAVRSLRGEPGKDALHDHPYSRPPEGDPEVIRRLSRNDILAYHRSRYVPSTWRW